MMCKSVCRCVIAYVMFYFLNCVVQMWSFSTTSDIYFWWPSKISEHAFQKRLPIAGSKYFVLAQEKSGETVRSPQICTDSIRVGQGFLLAPSSAMDWKHLADVMAGSPDIRPTLQRCQFVLYFLSLKRFGFTSEVRILRSTCATDSN